MCTGSVRRFVFFYVCAVSFFLIVFFIFAVSFFLCVPEVCAVSHFFMYANIMYLGAGIYTGY
jgi:hypothetical protein